VDGIRGDGWGDELASVGVDTVDALASPLIALINAPFRESVVVTSELECQHLLLAICSCLTICIWMLGASSDDASLLNHSSFHTPLLRASMRMMTSLRRHLPSIIHESARLLPASQIRWGIGRDVLSLVLSLVSAHSQWSATTRGSYGGSRHGSGGGGGSTGGGAGGGGGGGWGGGAKRRMIEAEPKCELERGMLERLVTHLALVYHVSLDPTHPPLDRAGGERSGGRWGGGVGGKGGADKWATVEAAEKEMGAEAACGGEGEVDWAWLRSAQRRYTFAELIFGAGGGDGGSVLGCAGQVCVCARVSGH
jgi:hypothetical protein